MVTDEVFAALQTAYAALHAEHHALQQQVATLSGQLATAMQRIGELEAKKTPPPSFVKANTPAVTKRERKRRAPEANRARRREEPNVVVRQALPTCPDCGGRLGGVHVGRRRQVVDLPPPAAVVVTEYQLERGWCSACGTWREARVDLAGQALGQGRLGIGIAALVAHLRTSLRLPLRRIQAHPGVSGRPAWTPHQCGRGGGAAPARGRARRADSDPDPHDRPPPCRGACRRDGLA